MLHSNTAQYIETDTLSATYTRSPLPPHLTSPSLVLSPLVHLTSFPARQTLDQNHYLSNTSFHAYPSPNLNLNSYSSETLIGVKVESISEERRIRVCDSFLHLFFKSWRPYVFSSVSQILSKRSFHIRIYSSTHIRSVSVSADSHIYRTITQALRKNIVIHLRMPTAIAIRTSLFSKHCFAVLCVLACFVVLIQPTQLHPSTSQRKHCQQVSNSTQQAWKPWTSFQHGRSS